VTPSEACFGRCLVGVVISKSVTHHDILQTTPFVCLFSTASVLGNATKDAYDNYRKNDDREAPNINLDLVAETLDEFQKYFDEHGDHESTLQTVH
jgi:hypothetical protein